MLNDRDLSWDQSVNKSVSYPQDGLKLKLLTNKFFLIGGYKVVIHRLDLIKSVILNKLFIANE